MKNYIVHREWEVIEDRFYPEYQEISESIFSIGNGQMGQRANFEEDYSGKTLQGSYLAGVYYPDKTRVGWWKNGYPEYFAKIINSIHWIGLHIWINGEQLDLATCAVSQFERKLDMKRGVLSRSFVATLQNGARIRVMSQRIFHLFLPETASLRYSVQALDKSIEVQVQSYMNGDVVNRDSNYDERFWELEDSEAFTDGAFLRLCTKKSNFGVRADLQQYFAINGDKLNPETWGKDGANVFCEVKCSLAADSILLIEKRVSIVTSQNYAEEEFEQKSKRNLALLDGSFEMLLDKQAAAWADVWKESDIEIQGDVAAQQAIRFNIFHLYQSYTGKDSRLNIGPKGFTGEKYGGVTYWDTEAYCLPFYLATHRPEIARNLLLYRYHHLSKAKENAEKLGFTGGAALYPMVTINGEECHNEWEITFEEIHRNGAIAYAIYNYVRYTGDESYLLEFGLEVLIAISRFWAQRVNWSSDRCKYVILGVTGPNEYENNVNNNWYTNRIAAWCLSYTLETLEVFRDEPKLEDLLRKLALEETEQEHWADIIAKMYYPEDRDRGVFLQQDGFLDKELMPAAELPASVRPLNQHWSWDRILRSCFIKQADVLQGLYFLESEYDVETIARNFDFYEPMTVHESSLSPCVHAILAAKMGRKDQAYEFYLRTARLDLDDYNNDTEDGLHITSMAGTWMAIVEGFAGMRVQGDCLAFSPILPEQWEGYRFRVIFREANLQVLINKDRAEIHNSGAKGVNILFNGTPYELSAGQAIHISSTSQATL